LAGLALLLSAPSPAGASQQDCSFHLPSFEQHKEYVTRLQNLTLFADCNTEGSYLYYRQWYTDQMPSRRWGSRGLALLVIVLGAILPLVVHIQKVNANYKLWVSLIGALIVIAQGLSQTFAYDAAWRNFMIARMKLEMAQDLPRTCLRRPARSRDIAVHCAPLSAALSKRLLWEGRAMTRDEVG
jgi:hypothetical protein